MLLDFFNKIRDVMDISKQKENILQEDLNNIIENNEKVNEEIDKSEEVKYVHSFGKCVLKEYSEEDGNIGCDGDILVSNYSVASHNIPCGTKIYIPSLVGKINKNGIFEVMDSGGCSFDFDIYLGNDNIGKIGNSYEDVYVLEWGNGKLTSSYTYIIDVFKKQERFDKYLNSWNDYKSKGKLIKFFKFNDEDKELNI
ncbi:hypothetical protein [Peptostreptococcus porci]|uniref:hypothetical protein n=1 Tax=Peptostreptococcus porci TaxID=2652282 RepID=UPI002A82A476|nr:hypothetical protein [Peptostreptococcus porci]MDY4127660.1 hypothetical protein [Peptostreptococcus porci]